MRTSRRAAFMAAVFSLGLAASAHAETLAEAVALAYQSNPSLLRQRSILRSADELYYRTNRTLGPTVAANVGVSGGTDNEFNGGTNSSTVDMSATVSASQVIYSGGRLRANMAAQDASLLSQREALRQADAALIQQVTDAYNGVLRAEEALAIARESVSVLDRSRSDASARFQVGTNTRTDVAQADARLGLAQANLITAQNNLDNAREQYRAVVGQSPTKLSDAPVLASLLPSTLAAALDVARENNPTLRQAYLQERVSAAGISAAKAALRPQISVGANYGYADRGIVGGGSSLLGDTSSLTTSAQITIPLYTGLTTSSTIRSAQETNTQDRIGIDQQRRSVQQTVTNAWNALIAARASIRANQNAVDAANLALEGVRQQLQVGIGTTLDLLNSEQDLRTTQLNLVNAKFTEYSAGISLLNAMGKLEVTQFAPEVAKYDPLQHFNEVNRFALPWEGLVEAFDNVGAAPIPVRQAGPDEKIPTFGDVK